MFYKYIVSLESTFIYVLQIYSEFGKHFPHVTNWLGYFIPCPFVPGGTVQVARDKGSMCCM